MKLDICFYFSGNFNKKLKIFSKNVFYSLMVESVKDDDDPFFWRITTRRIKILILHFGFYYNITKIRQLNIIS